MNRTAFLSLGLALSFAATSAAQRVWLPLDWSRHVDIEMAKGFFKSHNSVAFASGIVAISARIPVNVSTAITAAAAISRFGNTSPFAEAQSSTAFGNPWIGIEHVASPEVTIEAGFRPGVASTSHEDALILATIDDFDRFEAWLPKISSFRATAHVGKAAERGTFVTGRFGGTLITGSGGSGSDLYADYGVRLGFREEGRLASLALTGRARLTHGGTLDSRTVHQLTFIIEKTTGSVRPRGSIGSYLDESARQTIAAIVSVGVAVVY